VVLVGIRWAAALMLAAGLLIEPVAALYCDTLDAASMACCQGDMAGCNQPGKTEDCCRKGVANRETPLDLVKASRLDKPGARSFPGLSLAAYTLPIAVLPPSGVFALSHPVPRAAPSPPLISVLRV
jgi:hypothetical protein